MYQQAGKCYLRLHLVNKILYLTPYSPDRLADSSGGSRTGRSGRSRHDYD
jgi:hypothetical protein